MGGNSFRKIRYFLGKSLFSYGNHSISTKNTTTFCEFCEKDARFSEGSANFCEFYEKDVRFQREILIFVNSAKKTHVFRAVEFIYFLFQRGRIYIFYIVYLVSFTNKSFTNSRSRTMFTNMSFTNSRSRTYEQRSS